MVLKHCHSRFWIFNFNHLEKRHEAAFRPNKVSLCVQELSGTKKVAAIHTSNLRRLCTPSFLSSFERPRWRRAPGLKLKDKLPDVRLKAIRELNTSVKALQYDIKPEVPKTEGRRMFFDTHAVVRILEDNGFTPQQAEVIVKLLLRTTNSNLDIIYSDMVTKVQQEIVLQQVMSKIVAVKKDMIILEKSEFSALLAENERLKIHLQQQKVQLADVMNKVRSNNVLDMNSEKSRVKIMKAEHEKKLLETRTEIKEMTAEQDGRLTETNMKIDTEVAGLKTMLEAHKLDTIKYLAGSVFTCLTVVLGFYRIWM
ncbi:mitochondrial calcium uniporter regulator 1 [Nematolebias whitei]|uniref:mitochondrial calcium uniporter regulator 1 n=1 Tax=Nematolebias whitei TaxID=451745 RepID=UPI0018976AF5|nr:mitochondrial calcium uniporter regulator 1 [Nematolebias whitei]